MRRRIVRREKVRTADSSDSQMSIQLAGFDCVRQLEGYSDRALGRIARLLIQLGLFDGDSERRSLRFVSEPLHSHMTRKKFLVEYDAEFLIGRPIFGRLEDKDIVFDPVPGAVHVRLKIDAL